MTATAFLRRSLAAPILIPVLALPEFSRSGCNFYTVPGFLMLTLIFGGIPYLSLLVWKRRELAEPDARDLLATIGLMPVQMMGPYLVWLMIMALLLFFFRQANGFFYLGLGIIGGILTPLVGYLYVLITVIFLKLFQVVGLIV